MTDYDVRVGSNNNHVIRPVNGLLTIQPGSSKQKMMISRVALNKGECLLTSLVMNGSERRFGFSMMGGNESNRYPRVDSITDNSPGSRADLVVGDEILEVNNHSLENASHEEIISLIQQCIQSRAIGVMVRRRIGLPEELGTVHKNIQEHYLVSPDSPKQNNTANHHSGSPIRNGPGPVRDHWSTPPVYENNSPHRRSNPSLHSSFSSSDSEGNNSDNINNTRHDDLPSSSEDQSIIISEQRTDVGPRFADFSQLRLPSDVSSVSESDISAISPQYMDPYHYLSYQYSPENQTTPVQSDTENSSRLSESQIVLEPHISPETKLQTNSPVNFAKLFEKGDISPHNVNLTQPTPEIGDKTDMNRFPQSGPREVAVDVPDDFVFVTPGRPSLPSSRRNSPNVTPTSSKHASPFIHRKKQSHNNYLSSDLVNNNNNIQHEHSKQNSASSSIALSPQPQLPPYTHSPPVHAVMYSNSPNLRHISTDEVLLAIRNLPDRTDEINEDVAFLNELLLKPHFQQIVKVHDLVAKYSVSDPRITPVTLEAQTYSQEVQEILNHSKDKNAIELRRLLHTPSLNGLLLSHDKVANNDCKSLSPDTHPISSSESLGENLRIVRIEKTLEPLGITVKNDGDSVLVGRVVKGGVGDKCGLIHEEDEIIEINNMRMIGRSVNEISDIMANLTGTLVFLIKPAVKDVKLVNNPDKLVHVRALFDYDPEDDLFIPCRELGLSFQKGDVLHIIDGEDENWWQAFRDGEDDQTLAGLIPSRNFQQQRMARSMDLDVDDGKKNRCKMSCLTKKKKKRRKMYDVDNNHDYNISEFVTYEDVTMMFPDTNSRRPLFLIGPKDVGRYELRQKLLEHDTNRFTTVIPYTTKPITTGSRDSYQFVTKQEFQLYINQNMFLEHVVSEKHMYGITRDSVHTMAHSGKCCITCVGPQQIKELRTADLKPYFIFVAPPSIEKLRQNRAKAGQFLKDEQLRQIIVNARNMEEEFGHYFDYVVVNSDTLKSFADILAQINCLDQMGQWVPSSWVNSVDDFNELASASSDATHQHNNTQNNHKDNINVEFSNNFNDFSSHYQIT